MPAPTSPSIPTLEIVDPRSIEARGILRAYWVEIVSRYWNRPATDAEVERALTDEPSDELRGASGVMVVARNGQATILGCGAFRVIDETTGELTRIFVSPEARGTGTAARIIGELERLATERGLATLRLDTRSDLVEARRLYARLGYGEVPPFNESPYADHWFAKRVG